jgi:hypothetical protein
MAGFNPITEGAKGGVMTPNTIVVSAQCQKAPRPVQVSIIRNIFAEPESICFDSVEQLIEQLSACSKDTIADKKFNILISPATFVPTAETKRGRANVSFCDGIWLDQDGGALTPQLMQTKFPGLRFIATNTFSGYTRYFIPTSRPVTADEYERIWDYLTRTIDMPDSGIDVSKRPACSIFYLPSQAKDPSKNFWFEQQGEYLNCDANPAAPVLPVVKAIRPVIHQSSSDAPSHVLSIINGTGAGRHNRDYTRIVGFIQHNRQSFSDGDLQNILNAWRQVDSTKSRSKDFWKAVNKPPKSADSQIALAA